ncbi:MAG: hypothetical protein RL220_917 [Bacteroidota bacterium]
MRPVSSQRGNQKQDINDRSLIAPVFFLLNHETIKALNWFKACLQGVCTQSNKVVHDLGHGVEKK